VLISGGPADRTRLVRITTPAIETYIYYLFYYLSILGWGKRPMTLCVQKLDQDFRLVAVEAQRPAGDVLGKAAARHGG
jgi:hypothetical protein